MTENINIKSSGHPTPTNWFRSEYAITCPEMYLIFSEIFTPIGCIDYKKLCNYSSHS